MLLPRSITQSTRADIHAGGDQLSDVDNVFAVDTTGDALWFILHLCKMFGGAMHETTPSAPDPEWFKHLRSHIGTSTSNCPSFVWDSLPHLLCGICCPRGRDCMVMRHRSCSQQALRHKPKIETNIQLHLDTVQHAVSIK